MPGKPHETSFPEETFTVKDLLISIVNGRVLIRPPVLTVSFTANLVCWPAIATDSCRDAFRYKSIRYNILSIADDSPRRT